MSGDLSIRGLKKVFKTKDDEVVAIDDFTLDVKQGELVSLLGPSGCGKTTILRLVAGLSEPTAGEILLGGKKVSGPGADRGMIFQEFALFPWRSVRKNIEFGLEIAGIPKAERRQRSQFFLDMVGLERFADARIHELSGGMKQRVGIARALANDPEILLMDEPFGALDAQTRNIMQKELLKIMEKTEKTILFVTHSVDEAVYLSDRVVVLTKRPAHIKEIIEVPWPRPRDRAAPEVAAMRKKILRELEEENVMDN
ncbi:MAG: sulfonate transport system ATP-binding protein [Candidatus Methanomethylophilaceae archaeon]|nr:sulfonate transport system ATP-binding protein [Candidatus Methanomethylophilaceae archaeon]MDI3541235.1 sulfonate transport system ATP-binding protein [Candidatus Methanomethylophilaceae archaeon]HIJ00717.1 ABC transporter ATP-binding protein [Candidatus Methanomethylophilaceae archaeon]